MQVKCFKMYAVFCFLGIVLASPEEQLETLLRKPFWRPLMSKTNNLFIYAENHEFEIRELFGTDLNPAIVDKTNVNVKIHQFYHLLITVYATMLMNYLRFFDVFEYQSEKRNTPFSVFNMYQYYNIQNEKKNFPLDCKNEVLNLIEVSKPALAMMVNSVLFLKGLYNDEVNVPLKTDTTFLLAILLFTHLNTPDEQKFFSYIRTLWKYVESIRSDNNLATLEIQYHLDVQEINEYHFNQFYRDFSAEKMIEHSEKFKILNNIILKKIEEIGFQYNESTHNANLILEQLEQLFPKYIRTNENLE